jgi:hypothetical protein
MINQKKIFKNYIVTIHFYTSSSDEDINQNRKATKNQQREGNTEGKESVSLEHKRKRHRSRSSRRSSSRSSIGSHKPRQVFVN